jgi:cholesterol oxidase
MTGVRFSEKMSGTVASTAEPASRSRAVLRGTVSIPDLDAFFDDPNHQGLLEGHVRVDAFASGWLPARGHVRLFSMGTRLGERLMVYRMEFELGGARYAMDGTKYVFDDPGFDAWRDVTTLRTSIIRYGQDGQETVELSGTLRLTFLQGVLLFLTLRGTGGGGFFARLRAVMRFAQFFLGEWIERFLPLATRGKPTAG